MLIYSCGIIHIFFSWSFYLVVQADGMVGAGVLNVPTLGDGAVILRAILGVVEVFTLCVDVSPTLCVDDVCTAIEGAPGLFRRY